MKFCAGSSNSSFVLISRIRIHLALLRKSCITPRSSFSDSPLVRFHRTSLKLTFNDAFMKFSRNFFQCTDEFYFYNSKRFLVIVKIS